MSIHFVNTEDLLGHWRAYEEEALANAQKPRRSEWRIARDILVAPTPGGALCAQAGTTTASLGEV